jgi:hypothetical protein
VGMARTLSTSTKHLRPSACSTGGRQSTSSKIMLPSGLHPWHPQPVGQDLEASSKGWRADGCCPRGRHRVSQGRLLSHDFWGLPGI